MTTQTQTEPLNRFVALRFRRGISQGDLAAATDLSRGTITNLERGGAPTAPTAFKLAQFYGVRVEQIMGAEPLDDADAA
jgi:transcriptional regulator with XRE-family HTH domain